MVNRAEILSAPGTTTEKAQPAPFLRLKTARAVLRVVKYLSLGSILLNPSSATFEVGRIP
jgi:hypothetical protein